MISSADTSVTIGGPGYSVGSVVSGMITILAFIFLTKTIGSEVEKFVWENVD